MGNEKRHLGQVAIPEECKKWFRYVDKDGNVYALKPGVKKLSIEEKTKREAERKKKHEEELKIKADARKKYQNAKDKVRKDPSVKNAENLEAAKAEYEIAMGRD